MSSASNESTAGQGQLGLWDAVSIIVGIVIGTTIYKVPWLIFGNSMDPLWGLLVWVIGGALALIGAFCYAELASTYPKAGGDYYYLSQAFGPGAGFLFGWAQLAIVMPASIGAMAYVFADFLQRAFFPQGIDFEVPIGATTYQVDPHFAIAAYVVLLLTFTNVLGVFLGKWVQNLLTLAKIVGITALIAAGFGQFDAAHWEYVPKTDGATPYLGSLAIILVMYAYGGWNDSAFVAAEVRNPKRNIPRALFYGVGLIIFIYLLVNVAYINGLGWASVSGFDPVPVPARLIKGSWLGDLASDRGFDAGQVMSVIVMVSAVGAVNGLIFTGARVYATLGSEHALFGWMGRWRPGKRAPIVALLLQAALTIFIVAAIATEHGHDAVNATLTWLNDNVLANASSLVSGIDDTREIPSITFEQAWKSGDGFDKLVDRTAPVFWLFFLLTGISLFVLREKNRHLERAFSTPCYPWVPLIFINSCAWMLYQATKYVEWHALFAGFILFLGVPLYALSRMLTGPVGSGPIDVGLPRKETDATLQHPRSGYR